MLTVFKVGQGVRRIGEAGGGEQGVGTGDVQRVAGVAGVGVGGGDGRDFVDISGGGSVAGLRRGHEGDGRIYARAQTGIAA